jgi:hypothetical protein
MKHFYEYVMIKPCASQVKVGEEIGKSKVGEENGNM